MIQRTETPFRIVAVVGNIAEDGQATSAVPYVYTCNAAALTLAIVSAIAVAGPALKAARIAPIDALKGE